MRAKRLKVKWEQVETWQMAKDLQDRVKWESLYEPFSHLTLFCTGGSQMGKITIFAFPICPNPVQESVKWENEVLMRLRAKHVTNALQQL